MIKIIFLDIDGVLNNSLEVDPHKDSYLNGEYQGLYSPRCIKHLNDIIKQTGAKIVVSSTWRLGRTIKELQKILDDMGVVGGEVVGATPSYYDSHILRGNEILKWTQENKELLGCEYYNFTSYVILDDDTDMNYWQRGNFVVCDNCIGLTDRVTAQAISILNRSVCVDAGQDIVKEPV